MSSFATLFNATGRGELMTQFAESVIYDPDGAATTLQAIVGKMEIVELQVGEGIDLVETRRITITTDPSSEYGGVASVDLTKVFEFAGENWSIMEREGQTGGMVTLRCRRREIVERSRRGMRMELDG